MTPISEQDLRNLYQRISNWGRWGADDERGTLNLIDDAARLRGLQSAKDGLAICCGLTIPQQAAIDRNRYPVQRFIFRAGDQVPANGFGSIWEFLGMVPHGPAHTHIDALCHAFHDGRMYNGRTPTEVLSTGARRNAITAMNGSISARGILLDIPALLGVDYLEPERPIKRAELEAAERAAGVTVASGDVLLVRTGRHVRYRVKGPGSEQLNGKTHVAGFYADCLTFMRERDVAVLGSDGVNEHLALSYGADERPIHQGCLVYMGLPLIHNCDLDLLAEACAHKKRASFLFTMGLITFEGATSAPVAPVAIL